jgi:Flp pilus assembly protein TadG
VRSTDPIIFSQPLVRHERGSIVVLTAGILAIVGVLMAGMVQLVVLLGQRTQAQNAADAAALAGVIEGRDAANDTTAANEATIIGYFDRGAWVDVEVRVGRATARARALRHVETPLARAVTGPRTPVRVADGLVGQTE